MRARRLGATTAALLVLGALAIPPTVAAQAEDVSDMVRITARKLSSGTIEFGLQQRTGPDAWGERMLPASRFFPADAAVDRWLRSSPLTVSVADTTARPATDVTVSVAATAARPVTDVTVRIVARRVFDGRIEFALRKQLGDGSHVGPLLPRSRFFPTTAAVGNWLVSTPISVISTQPSTTSPTAPSPFTTIDGGRDHTCGLRADGTVDCWGENLDGQSDAPRGSYTAVSAGDEHSCAIRSDRTVTCWGENGNGQAVAPSGEFTAVTAGTWHSCGLRADGTITCWGNDSYRQRSGVPSGGFSAISAGRAHTCVVDSGGSIDCWGGNPSDDHGQASPPAGRFSAVTAGDLHTCGLRTNGTVTCWGDNGFNQLDAPASRFVEINAGHFHTCGVRANGSARCWGDNFTGHSDAPSGRFSAVAAGRHHSCGLRNDGTVTCWGFSYDFPPRPERLPVGNLRRRQRGLPPHVRPARRRHRGLLGMERHRPDRMRGKLILRFPY